MFGFGLPELIIVLIILAILLVPAIIVLVIVSSSKSGPMQQIQNGGVMFCTKCGKENEANATHCVECGEAMTFTQPQAAAAPAQPQAAPGQPTQVPNYLVQAILVTIFCCLPFGIVAIVFAAQVNGKLQAGDINGAMESSRKAKMWSWLGFGIGLAFALLYAVFVLLVGVGSQIQ